jgi:integrase
MRGAPIKAVQELLGHASIEMTMRYAHLSPDARRDAVGLLDLAASPGGVSPAAAPGSDV